MSWIKDVDGYPVPDFAVENYKLVRDLSLRQGDVIISTYPKCGSHWVAYIVWRIQRPNEPHPDGKRIYQDVVFVDKFGLGPVSGLPEDASRTFLTHIPSGRVSDNACAKYVVMARNPFDCLVSFYHFIKQICPLPDNEPGDSEIPRFFFDQFISGTIAYGCFFDHMKKWYKRRDEPNVHFVVFEKMKANPKEEILKLATFLGGQDALLENEGKILDQIIEDSSFDKMNKNIEFKDPIFRKGQVGSYKDSLTEDQVQKIRQKMEAELEGTELLELWRHL